MLRRPQPVSITMAEWPVQSRTVAADPTTAQEEPQGQPQAPDNNTKVTVGTYAPSGVYSKNMHIADEGRK